MERIGAFLHSLPVLCLFLAIFLGQILGRIHFKGVGFGAVVGTLLAGMLIGIPARPELPELLRWAFFYLFLFSIGYSVGPQFFGSLRREALPQVALAFAVALGGLAAVIGVSVAFGFDEGTAVGILSGGMTQSAALGTGLSAISELAISAEEKVRLAANAPLADAITYGFGDFGLILFLTWLGPKLMRADLRRDAKEIEAKLAANQPAVRSSAIPRYGVRAYRVEDGEAAGATVSALEARFAEERLSVQRVERAGTLLAPAPGLGLERGDRLVVSAQRRAFVDVARRIGPEIDDPDLLAVPVQATAIVVTQRKVHGRALGDLVLDPAARGVYLSSIERGGKALPRETWTVVERGDVFHVFGAHEDVERFAAHAGVVERDLSKTDLMFLAGGISAGILLGLLQLKLGGVVLGLGTAGSILVVALVGGWARSRYPVFGAIPEPAQRLLMDVGLIVFVAMIGLHAGPHAVEAFRSSGAAYFAKIFVAGVIVTIVPLATGMVVGRYLLKMSPLLVLGGLAGAQTCTPGLDALRQATGSNVGTLAYTVPYALANIILTIWGPVVVAIVHALRP